MKRLSLLFALSIVLLSFGLANAIVFEVEVDPSKTFVHPTDMNTYYMANQQVYLDIKMGNNDGVDWTGFSQTHKFYSTNGDGTPINWIDAGGTDLGGSLTRMNYWINDYTTSPPTFSYYITMNDVAGFSWDGILPDTMNHTAASTTGWPFDSTEVKTRLRFHFSVPVAGNVVPDDIVEICIDQSNGGSDTYDWLFSIEQDFGGPYCFKFVGVPNLPPAIAGAVPLSLSTPHDVAFALGPFTFTDVEGDPVTDVTADLGDVVFSGTSFTWSYDPPCDWVDDELSHSVTFSLWDNVHGHTPGTNTYTVDLTATNSAPTIGGDCNKTVVAGINKNAYANFTTTDPNDFDVALWSVEVAVLIQPNDGGAVTAPYGTFGVVGGAFTFSPLDDGVATFDDGATYVFTITVTDCAGYTASCDVTFEVISQEPFAIKMLQRIGNDDSNCDYAYLGQHAYVDVVQELGTENNLGFDFLIAYDNSALAFMGAYGNPDLFAIPGTYEWEYFTYRFVDNCGGSCPSGLLQVVAIADQNDGMHSPKETILPEGFVLFTMDFMVTNDYTLECSFVPISFFWRDCTDNSIAMNFRSEPELEVVQAISDHVYGYNGTYFDVTDRFDGFPTFYGAQDSCLNTDQLKGNIDFIDFYNGGIKICCSDEIDARGDINLNGVMNEIADAVVFTNYFIHGMDAFTINKEGQKAATDVNNDGIVLSVADLVYLIRVIVGDVLPIEKLNPNMVAANIVQGGQLVSVDVELGAALFVLEGNVEVNLAQGASHMMIKSDVVNGNTRALVYSFDQGATFSGNVLNTDGKVISVEAADYNGTALKTVVLPSSFSVRNFPNPFNPATTISMALPVATNWNLTIYNVAGQKVAEFSGFAEAGINNVVWDAASSASGIYFYKVTTDNGSMTKKMVLLK